MKYGDSEPISVSFMRPGVRIWDKEFLEKMIKFLKKYQLLDNEVSNERCFAEFILEVEQAYRVFLEEIKDLPIIMKCRVKGDGDSHFGGQECAEFAKTLRHFSEKYLKSTNFKHGYQVVSSNFNQNSNVDSFESIYDFISRVRDLARTGEQIAKEIEVKVHQEYVSLGKDHTLDALKEAGYNFDNISL